MRKNIFLAFIGICGLFCSCRQEARVVASFELDKDVYQILDLVSITNTSTASNTFIGMCKWECGDMVSYDMELEDLTFDTVGEYPLSLTVYADEGVAMDKITKIIVVEDHNVPPVADFSLPEGPYEMDKPLQFTDKSTDEFGGIVSWEWNIGGVSSSEQNPRVSIISWGEVTVSLTVTDFYGASDTKTKTINVQKSTGHDLQIEWAKNYDTTPGAKVRWSSPAMNADGSLIYVTSSGYNLVCFDPQGNKQGSFDLSCHGVNVGNRNYTTTTPSVDASGNVYLALQYMPTSGNGGLISIEPECRSERWYYPTGANSSYSFIAPVVSAGYVFVNLRENNAVLMPQNAGVFSAQTGELLQALACDYGTHGGAAMNSQNKIVYNVDKPNAGFKVAIPTGGNTWTTSANGYFVNNFLGNLVSQDCGAQIAISNVDGAAYVFASMENGNVKCAKYDLNSFTGLATQPFWIADVSASISDGGYGVVLDYAGNAYYASKTKLFRLNGRTGEKEWEFLLQSCCPVAAIDDAGYIYVSDVEAGKLYKLSSANGLMVASIDIPSPWSSPTIGPDGSVYVNANGANGPTLYKITGSGENKSKAPGYNWSQLGCNYKKNGAF